MKQGDTTRHYEMLITSLQQDHREYIDRTRRQKSLLHKKIKELQGNQEVMQIALVEATKQVVQSKTEKEDIQMRLEELQSSIEGRITSLRRQIEDIGAPSHSVLKENEELRATVKDLKVLPLGGGE